MYLRLIITKRSDDYQVYPAGDPTRWDCGKTKSEAIGKWIITHGIDFGIENKPNNIRLKSKTSKTKP